MSKIFRRAAAVLTAVLLTSFTVSHAQNAAGPRSAFRDTAGWTIADGVVTLTGAPSRDTPLYTRQALADSVTAFDFRAPKGAKATRTSRDATASSSTAPATGKVCSIRFRAPRMDAGFKKIANAFMLETRVGADVHQNVVFEKPSEGARWDAEDFRGPIVFYVTQGAFALRNVSYEPADFSPLTVPKASGGDDQ